MIIIAFFPLRCKPIGPFAGPEVGDLLRCTYHSHVDFGPLWCKIAPLNSHPAKETWHMSLESHLAELERRHRALEDEISEALAHPSSDGLKIAELKRRKLQVKDEIARLQHDHRASVH